MRAPPGYRYLRHLGAGGFGEVHLAEHLATGRKVAVKYIQPHALRDPETLARFRREAKILAATDVPTVVRVYDLNTTDEPAFLVMEYVPGVTLWDLMALGPLPAWQGLAALRDVADALDVMSRLGLVHRDIKPSNVFVLPDGRAKLGDFGLARAVFADAGFRTAGAPAGTPAYFPPEVSSGQADATPESDAYSFAIMVYEVLTGAQPITAPDAISLVTAHWTQAPRSVFDAMPGFPQPPGELLMRALAKQPSGRPLPRELMSALDAVPAAQWPTNHRPALIVPGVPEPDPAWVTPMGGALSATSASDDGMPSYRGNAPPTVGTGDELLPPQPPRTLSTAGPPPRRTRRRGPAILIAAAAAVAAVVAAGASWSLLERSDPDPAGDTRRASPELRVETLELDAEPDRGRCPGTKIRLVATVRTNGEAGDITVVWHLPNGEPGPQQRLSLPTGQTEAMAFLDLDLTGRREISAPAAATVRPSGMRDEVLIRYRCG